MGRKPTTNLNLPKGMRARKRYRKDGTFTIHYFYDVGDKKRTEIPLGKDYHTALKKWADLDMSQIPKTGITFVNVALRYKNEVMPTKAPKTARENQYQLENLMTFFGGDNPAPLEAIEPQHIKEYLRWRSNAPVAANRELALFSHIWTMCSDEHWGYTSLPCPKKGVKLNKETPREVYVEDYLYDILYQFADPTMKDAMDIAYLIGQRPADVLKIQVHHIHDNILTIKQNKTNARLRFAISGSLKNIIDRRLETASVYLLCNSRGKQLTVNAMEKRFAKMRAAAIAQYPELESELVECQFRDLRAKSGTDVYLSAESMEAAQKQLGHTDKKMTQVYIRREPTIQPLDVLDKKKDKK
ncbi:tyrosine-type recombinase/integrase [Alysiella crassa]|uniref:Site-specific recombinase XerD n=1 Tax=Alysiella crassa TaxID=153491 RepID=A0A376BVV9_9NEIS|nr:tyrosine-type recombinase/integrase [Alysiella crassa]UOP06553.1 tyrosine-type recombinase/integrase [Alysiella crassa]SSY81086.1 Site-specific recombinase XerD [Alysiella crassa]